MKSVENEFLDLFYRQFPYEPTQHQQEAAELFAAFSTSDIPNNVLILTGYAGTGKTSLVGSFVQTLKQVKRFCSLLAPTGRAAKVFSGFAGQKAFTIHKKIYRKQKVENGSIQLVLAPNLSKNTIFFVDEASMIGDFTVTKSGDVSERNLLEDLFNFVFSGENCSLVLIGDEAQLPPVGSDFSPALQATYLQHHFPKLQLAELRLTEVLRQAADSEILSNAGKLRESEQGKLPHFSFKKGKQIRHDLFTINGLEFPELLEESYNEVGVEETIIVTRSNKRANAYNQEIRKRILFYEEEISSGDLIMAVKNNYFWVPETSDAGFIANGELLKVKKVMSKEELYGFSFQKAVVELIDYPDMGDFQILLLMDTILGETPSLSREDMKKLFFAVEQDYSDERNKKTRYAKILADPYFNALQIKFAYAVTCHKAQGGQWENVFLDHGFIAEDQFDQSLFRWLYTGFTRAKEKLYLVNFDERFF